MRWRRPARWALAAGVAATMAVGLWWVGGSGTGPSHRCDVRLYRDGTYQITDPAVSVWPPPNCNFVVHLDQGGGH